MQQPKETRDVKQQAQELAVQQKKQGIQPPGTGFAVPEARKRTYQEITGGPMERDEQMKRRKLEQLSDETQIANTTWGNLKA